MTTQPQAVEAIYQKFVDGWNDAAIYTLEGEKFDSSKDVPHGSPYVRVSVRHTGGTQHTLGKRGNRKFERSGSVFVQVFVPSGEGVFDSGTLAQAARAIFEGEDIPGTTVFFQDVVIRETGPSGKWLQTVVEASFQYTETK